MRFRICCIVSLEINFDGWQLIYAAKIMLFNPPDPFWEMQGRLMRGLIFGYPLE
jgi:hypothetical protein